MAVDTGAFDREVGARIRRRRRELGMSQKAFGQHLNISFQQVQKYENGSSRLLAWRLYVISRVLGVSVPSLLGLRDTQPAAAPRDETTRLVEAWSRIPSEPLRGQLLRLIETLALEADDAEPAKADAWIASQS